MNITGQTYIIQPPESAFHDITYDVSDADVALGWWAYCRKCQRRFMMAAEWTISPCNA